MDPSVTSVDYARIIRYIALRDYNQVLNKIQTIKILFIIYGRYLSFKAEKMKKEGKVINYEECKLFVDDTAKAWPYGPVFPIVFRKYERMDYRFNQDLKEKMETVNKDQVAVGMIIRAIKIYHTWSSMKLSEWSHEVGSPWQQTVKNNTEGDNITWNVEIPIESIAEYFKNNCLDVREAER